MSLVNLHKVSTAFGVAR